MTQRRRTLRMVGILTLLLLVAAFLSGELRSDGSGAAPPKPPEPEAPASALGNDNPLPDASRPPSSGGVSEGDSFSADPGTRSAQAGPQPPLTARERKIWEIGRRFWFLITNRGERMNQHIIAGTAAPQLKVILNEAVASRAGASLPVPSICFLGYLGDVHPYLRAYRVRSKLSYEDCGRYGILTRETDFVLRYPKPVTEDVPAVLVVMADGRTVMTDASFELLSPIDSIGHEVLHPSELRVGVDVRECRSTGLNLSFAWEDGVYHEVIPKSVSVVEGNIASGVEVSLKAYGKNHPLIRHSYLYFTTDYDPAHPPKRLRLRVRGEDGKAYEFDHEIE